MADLSDVESAIIALIAGLVYPNGAAQPSAVPNDAGASLPVKVYRGWPNPNTLDADLTAGNAHLSVFSRGTVERNTTRYPREFQTISTPLATVTARVNNNVAANQITIGGVGSATVSQYVTIIAGRRAVASYAVSATDTASSIAAALAALITAAFAPATSSGPNITVQSSAYLVANVGVGVQQLAETRRQQTQVQITLWCPTPATRDNIAKAIEPTLSDTVFLTLVDNSSARFRYHGTIVHDDAQKVQLYRRDLLYDIEYATTVPDTGYQITSITTNVDGGQGPLGTAPVDSFVFPTAPQS